MSDFLSFVVVEHIRFFHRVFQLSFQGYMDDGIRTRCYLFFDVCARKATQAVKCDIQVFYITFNIKVDSCLRSKVGQGMKV